MRVDRRMLLAGGVATMLAPWAAVARPRGIDIALRNARVWTGVAAAPFTDAIGIAGNRIAALGSDAVAAASGPATQVIDLDGAFVTPGMVDCHTHFLIGSAILTQPNLRDAATPEEFARRLGEAAARNPGKWIQGGNWDEQLWGGELPRRQWIDAVTPDTPVAVTRLDLHMILANSKALELAGITRDTPDPEGGLIIRDADGEPTGILKDNAKALVERVIPEPTDAEREASARAGIAHGLRHGVTQTHTTELDWITHDTLRRLRAQGETDMRFYSFVPLPEWEKLAALIAAEGRGDDWVRWGGLKGLVDGSLGSRTALFYQPYADAPAESGIRTNTLEDLRRWIFAADAAGLHITTHAIGDRANDELLDIYRDAAAANGPRDRRFRVEHAQHIRPESIPRFAQQGVIASVQPYHAVDDGRWAVKRIGPERLDGTYAFRSLIDSGATVCFGSDWPVAPFDPVTGIHAAITRATIDGANPDGWLPDQKLTRAQALTGYTRTPAIAGFTEDRLGAVAPGYLADLSVFDTDLSQASAEAIGRAKALRTFVNGKQRFGEG
ncbi:amidohydrolase [Stakelama tenebrarum]|uniref:Amidohydrolase n=1 Tax=Stakelama tenebrarum TaxID=2711215 RepID=A0A6G6Y3B5_9SPHN|nr:amidohydrolase [Sphingosinithalassobacter tenebrarum]QIG79389.1 amidohydrolase [Sphingosinithalassobacter tenebrarum]